MTRYEELMNKSVACLQAAKQTSGYMSAVWQAHAISLRKIAEKLPVNEGNKIVK